MLGKLTVWDLSFFLPCSSSLRGCRSKDPPRRGRELDKAERGTVGDWRRIRVGIPESPVDIVGRVYSPCWWSHDLKSGQTKTTQDWSSWEILQPCMGDPPVVTHPSWLLCWPSTFRYTTGFPGHSRSFLQLETILHNIKEHILCAVYRFGLTNE